MEYIKSYKEFYFMKKLIIDFDSTLVKIETLDKLAERFLENNENREEIITEIKTTTERGMNGEISFPESLSKRISLIKADKGLVFEVAEFIKTQLSDSILKNRKFFVDNKDDIIIISGGFRELIFPTSDFLGIDRRNIWANDFVFDEMGFLTGVNQGNLMAQDGGKVNQIKELKLKGELIMIGDGWTDYQTRESEVVDKFVAYTENIFRERVVEMADLVVDDFSKIIKIFYNE